MSANLPHAPTRVPEVYRENVVVDWLYNTTDTADHYQLARDSGLTVMQHSVTSLRAETAQAFKELGEIRNIIDEHADLVSFIGTSADVLQAKADGKVGILMGTQNAKFIQDELHYLRAAYEAGLRVFMLTHNTQNYIGGGCGERDDGLTAFGKRVVRECNRLGILVDVSHSGPQTTLDAIEWSEQPVIVTHSAPRALFPSFRNKSDEEIVRLAEKGGVFGILSWSGAIYRDPQRRPTLQDVLDAFDHVIRLVGPEHVVIGSDTNENKYLSKREVWEAEFGRAGKQGNVIRDLPWYGVDTMYAEDMDSVTHLPGLAEGLLKRGHSEEAVSLILGKNSLRIMETVIG